MSFRAVNNYLAGFVRIFGRARCGRIVLFSRRGEADPLSFYSGGVTEKPYE